MHTVAASYRRIPLSAVFVLAALAGLVLPAAVEAQFYRRPVEKKPEIGLEEKGAFPFDAHLEQSDIAEGAISHEKLLKAGSELFNTAFNGLDGVGMMRTGGGTSLHRFSTGPAGGGQPIAVTSQACGSCHNTPFAAGAGLAHTRVILDPNGDGQPPFSMRATTSLHGNGVLQLLAMEMTEELQATRDEAIAEARAGAGSVMTRSLTAKGVDFGTLSVTVAADGEVAVDTSGLSGVDPDLVVRPFGWKGHITVLRNFVAAAANVGMGMQAEEMVWRMPAEAQPDPDADGVERELSVGDVTAMTIYNAAQEIPQGVARLAELEMVKAPSEEALARVGQGRELFARVGCASCHRPELRLKNTVFEEPSMRGNGHYIDTFLLGKDANYDPERPARFDFLTDSQEPRLEAAEGGGAVVRLYGDLKRHRMGRHLADPGGPQPPLGATIAPLMISEEMHLLQPTEFLTPELWGVGSTSPYLHDDRAGSLHEAIALHGEDDPPAVGDPERSEAQEARDAYLALGDDEQSALVSFLKSLVMFSTEG